MSDEPTTNIAPMPKRAHHGALSKVTSLQDAFSHPDFIARIKQATPKHLSPDRMLAVFVQSVQKTPKLRECSLMSLLGAFLSVATVGLEPNTALQHAHLIPFAKRIKQGNDWVDGPMQVQVIFGYQGLLELAYRSGLLRSVHSDVAWSTDEFDFWYGSGGNLRHKPMGGTHAEGEMPDWAYMHANMKGEGESFEVMPISDVLAIRDNSQGYRAALSSKQYAKPGQKLPASYTEAPWVKHFIPMARKTAFRAGSKWLPKSIELAAALALDELQDRKTANFSGVIEGSAEVLTGLDTLSDEAGEHLDAGLGGTFTGYGQQAQREPVPAEAAGSPPPQQQAAAPVQQQQAAAPKAPPAQPAFAHYLVDAEGEVTADLFTDAGRFAEASVALWAAGGDPAVLAENNADALHAAYLWPSAAALLNTLPLILPAGDVAPDPMAIPMRMGAKGPDLAGWVKLAVAAIAPLDTAGRVAWKAANLPTYEPFPASRKMEIAKALAAPQGAAPAPAKAVPAAQGSLIGGAVATARQQAQPAAVPGAGSSTVQPAAEWAKEVMDQLSTLITLPSVVALAGRLRVRMDQMKHEDGGVWREVDQAFIRRMAELAPPPGDIPAPDGPLVQDGDPGPNAD